MEINLQTKYVEQFRTLYRIRRFEETVLENFSKGIFSGTSHTYLGQEANAVGILFQSDPEDIVFSNHRCHGHFLAYGGDMRALFAELMGRSTGVCGGRGGSQHLQWKNFYSNGIQGGIVPIATGMALAEKYKQNNNIAIAFLGDGTLGQGVVYESLNMASLWGTPILYVLENNRIAQTTSVELAIAGNIAARFKAFGIKTHELETCNVEDITIASRKIITEIRTKKIPQALILHTYRFGPHSKGDDSRDSNDVRIIKNNFDPLILNSKYLEVGTRIAVESEVDEEVRSAYQQALNDPEADPKDYNSYFSKTNNTYAGNFMV
ncbi:thiamine pyrophosphate-dependent dehydrogenase E1 component subunit alpha [Chloroflexota bacterium]